MASPHFSPTKDLKIPNTTSYDTDGSDIDRLQIKGSQQDGLKKAGHSTAPVLFHKVKDTRSILSLIVSNSKIFAGTQGGEVLVNTCQIL
jgi:hypothetical protein